MPLNTQSITHKIDLTNLGERVVFPLAQFTRATIQVEGTGAAWSTGVLTLKRSNKPTAEFHALPSPVTISGTGFYPSSGVYDVSAFSHLALEVTTVQAGLTAIVTVFADDSLPQTVGYYGAGYGLSTSGSNLISGAAIAAFGDGSDGDATISSGTTTLTRDTYYNDLTVNGTGILDCAGFLLFVNGTLDISAAPAGAIRNSGTAGTNASGTTAGTGGAAALDYQLGPATAGTNGRNGGTGAGTQATAPTATVPSNGGGGGQGSAGGAGSGGAGGALRAGGTATEANPIRRFDTVFMAVGQGSPYQYGAGGAGGGSGGGDGTAGGGSGGGGGGGGGLAIYARTILRSGSTTAGAISAAGGAGGNGGTPAAGNRGGGAGGGGGGGGMAYVCYAELTGSTATNCVTASGGAGGNGGNGTGTGVGGSGSYGGDGGRVFLLNLSTGVGAETTGAAGSAGTAGSGTTGGTGGAGGAANASL